MNETNLVKDLMKAASELGSRLFRNNVGMGWAPAGRASNVVHVKRAGMVNCHPGDVVVRKARPLHAGLCKGSSDLIGWSPLVITEEMVGKTVAVFTGAEVKTAKGRATDEQNNFVRVVSEHGGRARVIRTKDDLIALLDSHTL